jgi:beta-N-acetylhexosaminidase
MSTRQTDNELQSIISRMSIEEKTGAVCTFGFNGSIPAPNIYDYITRLHCGGLRLMPFVRTFGSYVDPKTGKTVVRIDDQKYFCKKGIPAPAVSAQEYKATLDRLQKVARNRQNGIPLHFSFDQEGDGTEANNVFPYVKIFPKSMGIRATDDRRLAYEVALATGRQGRAIGFNYIHGPVLDICVEPGSPEIYNRAFSDDVDSVTQWAIESCRGYRDSGVIATGKHFPGRGDSPVDAHFEIPVISASKETLLSRELRPYRECINQNLLPSIMLAHSIYPAIDEEHIATVSKKVVTGLLREHLGYDGVITTDSMTMGGIARRYTVPVACAMALAAGADLVLMKAQNTLVNETWNEIRRWIEEGRIAESELDRKIMRILKLKNRYGLFDTPAEVETVDSVLHDRSITQLAHRVGEKSLTVFRRTPDVLPLTPNENTVIIEQIYTLANNEYMHPGILFHHCSEFDPNCAYAEISVKADSDDEAVIQNCFEKFDTIVVTNFYGRGAGANTALLEKLIAKHHQKKVIVVTNTPYALSIPPSAKNVLISFGYTNECMQATASYLFGAGEAHGVIPVSNAVR